MATQPQTVLLRPEDFTGLDSAAPGELEKLFRALNTNTQGAQQAITAIQSNPLLSASYYRLSEGPYPTSSSPTCLLLQYRTGASWATVSAWGKDGRPVVEAWNAPALQNSWVNFGAGFATAGYYRDATGIVRLRGLVKSGSTATIFTLPVGYRPAASLIFSAHTNPGGVVARLDVQADGQVLPGTGTSNPWLSLDGISFKAEQ